MVKAGVGDLCLDYADLFFDIGVICLQTGDSSKAEQNFTEAFRVYNIIFADNPEALSEKKNLLLGYTVQAALGEKLN